ncbi:hypothetical protein B0T17DRAFT_512772 [Bombardia bombarda]|uniref:Uncharacterized protein n=1 Tax=Bombardia bombarda TaxID=252184 RepID=A0AA39TV78_9PEZI|nr:hypothetical protein B0T17DRAFT_512772 [Bombardia bombarda]
MSVSPSHQQSSASYRLSGRTTSVSSATVTTTVPIDGFCLQNPLALAPFGRRGLHGGRKRRGGHRQQNTQCPPRLLSTVPDVMRIHSPPTQVPIGGNIEGWRILLEPIVNPRLDPRQASTVIFIGEEAKMKINLKGVVMTYSFLDPRSSLVLLWRRLERDLHHAGDSTPLMS